MADPQPLLEICDVVAGYGKTEILHGVSVRVYPNEIVTIIGPNGSGKSTLLKSVFGLVTPQKGSIRFRGRDLTGTPPEKVVGYGISYVPQANNVFPSLTVNENLEMGAYLRDEEIAHRTEEMYHLFPDLLQRRSKKAGQLSGGQRQMLAFARAMMLDPLLLLLDEPSAGLAPNMVETLFAKVSEIHQTGVAVMIVEQNARQALRLSHRGYVLANGENRLDDTAAGLLENTEIGRLYLGGSGAG